MLAKAAAFFMEIRNIAIIAHPSSTTLRVGYGASVDH